MASRSDSPVLSPVEDNIKSMNIKSGNSSDEELMDTTEVERRIKREDGLGSDGQVDLLQHKEFSPKSPSKISPHASSLDGANDRAKSYGNDESDDQHDEDRNEKDEDEELEQEEEDEEELVGGDVTLKQEPGQPLKLERTASRKVPPRPLQLFDHYENKTEEAKTTFQLMDLCTYSSKALGQTESAMDCDCAEEWDGATSSNLACGDDSDCINRATKMECIGDCGCGADCQNQRFQRRQYADIAIIKTEKKGYGVRADSDLVPNEFIFEYIGEVINERDFRKRMLQYDDEGIKHFYFMSLSKGEFVDATKRGNLGRFCNHSCNPNCYVDKWVVGNKLRMGIFAERRIRAGEELVFNYNVDRYGADPQPCYCGEPNCTGYIGGKTQTERATKLPHATLEALGIDDGDGWDTAVARRPRKKRAGENDEEWVDSVQPMPLDEDGVTKVMAALMQCREKWIAVKLLGRIQRCEDASVRNRVIRMHGYQILKTAISTFRDDTNVVLQILEILDSFPRVTRNKIADSRIEDVIKELKEHEEERIAEISDRLLDEWSRLEVAYRIPRIKRDPNAKRERKDESDRRGREERRRRSRTRSRSRSPPSDAPKGPAAPTGPKNSFPQRAPFSRPFRPPRPLPPGWHTTTFEGRPYYYTASGQTSWTRPIAPAVVLPPSAPKPNSQQKKLDDIIAEIERANERKAEESKTSANATPQTASKAPESSRERGEKKPKWMSYDETKQKRLYENTIHPYIKHVVDKYKSKLPKEHLKDNFKTLSKKIVESDFRKKRVSDPTKIEEKKQREIKKYTKEYFDKLLTRHREHEQKKAAKLAARSKSRKEGRPVSESNSEVVTPVQSGNKDEMSDDDVIMDLSEEEDGKDDGVPKSMTPATPLDQTGGDSLKRKRLAGGMSGQNGAVDTDPETSPNKRARSATPPPPPPPPPPPIEDMPSGEPSPVDMTPTGGWGDMSQEAGDGGEEADGDKDEDDGDDTPGNIHTDRSQTVQT